MPTDPTPLDDATWHRVKWTDKMVRLLVAAVAAIDRNPNPSTTKKPNRWKTISTLMSAHSFAVSPQQCEDKFCDLTKRYRRLNEILGRGTSCDVVENPSLLDSIPISERSKKMVQKILSSKQLFYKEMCAFHNGYEIPNTEHLEIDLDDNDTEEDERDGALGRVRARMIRVEEERGEIEKEMVELRKQRMKWMRFRNNKEWEMESKELENARMMLENKRMMMAVRRKVAELETKRVKREEE